MKRNLIATVFTFIFVTLTHASINYYPDTINKGSLKNSELKTALFETISKDQKSLDYNGAKAALFQKLYLKKDPTGFYVEDVYCQTKFSKESGVGPTTIPNASIVNVEHTWPQSKFSNFFPKEVQKTDLHHLYPADSKANGTRANYDFAEVAQDNGRLKADCNESKFGSSEKATSGNYFEPPAEHKGNVARALFYFSVRYKMSIDKNEEEFLRAWDKADPVDQEEKDLNESIFAIQGNRNPFIDIPNLADNIDRFN